MGLSRPKTINNLPERNRFFTGPVDVLNKLDELIKSNQQVAIKQAISGMGGIGKTQTALEFCYLHINDYQTILWVNAENGISFNVSCSKIVKLLNLPLTNTSTKITDTNEKQTVETLVFEWLMNNPNWLMVLDNFEDPKLIKDYLPPNHQGHVLITTQQHDLGVIAKTITLDKMDSNTGSLFLLKRSELLSENDSLDKANPNDLSVAQEIVKEMDGLPLALDQAGAYIRQTQSRLQEYLDLYKNAKHAAKLRDKRGKHTDDHISVTATFQLAFNKVKQKNSTATKVLEVCSFLDPNLIPEEIFTQANNFLNDGLAALVDDPFLWPEVLEALSDYSLVKRDTSNKSLSIHRLVQAVIRDLLTEDNKKLLVDSLAKTLDSLSNNDAEDPKNWPFYQKLLPSVTSLFDFAKLYKSNAIETARLFNQFGVYSYKQALFTQSLIFYNLVLDITKLLFGDYHPCIAETLNNIAVIYNLQGNYFQALDDYNQALNIKKHHFGDNHPDVAKILNNIAEIHQTQGNYSLALDFLEQALNIKKHHFGDNHPDVATALNNLGVFYDSQGKYSDALDLYNQALTITKHHFGDFHPNVADSLNNIANIYNQQGKYQDSLDFYFQSLAIYKHHFGDNHPSVAQTLSNIANVYQAQGKYSDALDFYHQALNTRKYYFGDNHYCIAETLNNIGLVYESQGIYPDALDFYNQSLTITKLTFGNNHPNLAQTFLGIANIYSSQGKYSLALDFYFQSLAIKKHHFGDNHPDVAMTLENLGHLHKTINKEVEAIDYYKQALAIYDQVFPANHPWITQLLNQYSKLLLKLNRTDEAQPLLDRLASLESSS